jgi:hypothetical protein
MLDGVCGILPPSDMQLADERWIKRYRFRYHRHHRRKTLRFIGMIEGGNENSPTSLLQTCFSNFARASERFVLHA